MTRVVSVVMLMVAALAAPLAAEAQQTKKVYRIGVLCTMTCATPEVDAFQQALREMGYVDGQNIVLELHWTEGRLDRLPTLAAELVALKVDIILSAGGTATALAARDATSTIPIVLASAADPVRSGLVASLARPGGNITGLSLQSSELNLKRLELLKQAVPTVSRVGYLWARGTQTSEVTAAGWTDFQAGARSLGMALRRHEVGGPDDLATAFAALVKERSEALLVQVSVLFVPHLTEIADLAVKRRLPAIAEPKRFAQAGGLLAYGPSVLDSYRRAATYVDKILKGAKPADLPIEQPTKFELVINLKTAKALGLTIPPAVLARADEIIQ